MRAAIRKMKRMRGIRLRAEAGKQPTQAEATFYRRMRIRNYYSAAPFVSTDSGIAEKIKARMKGTGQ